MEIDVTKSVNAKDLIQDDNYNEAESADNFADMLVSLLKNELSLAYPGATINLNIYVDKDRNNTDCAGVSNQEVDVNDYGCDSLSAIVDAVNGLVEQAQSKVFESYEWLVEL